MNKSREQTFKSVDEVMYGEKSWFSRMVDSIANLFANPDTDKAIKDAGDLLDQYRKENPRHGV